MALIWVAAALLAFGYLGSYLRPADSIALLRPVLAIVALAGVFIFRSWALRLSFLFAPLLALAALLPPFVAQSSGGDLRLYSKNLREQNQEIPALVQDILDAEVEVVMLQELSIQNDEILERLKEQFPFQHLCRFTNWSGIAILSKHPFVSDGQCTANRALATVDIDLNGQAATLVSVHLPWPWPAPTSAAEADARELLAELKHPMVLAGDFNTMPWTQRLASIMQQTRTKLAGPVRTTFTRLPLPLDFALAPGGGSIEIRGAFGSDHKGLVADLAVFGTASQSQNR